MFKNKGFIEDLFENLYVFVIRFTDFAFAHVFLQLGFNFLCLLQLFQIQMILFTETLLVLCLFIFSQDIGLGQVIRITQFE